MHTVDVKWPRLTTLLCNILKQICSNAYSKTALHPSEYLSALKCQYDNFLGLMHDWKTIAIYLYALWLCKCICQYVMSN